MEDSELIGSLKELFQIIEDASGAGGRTQVFSFLGLLPHHLEQGTVHPTFSLLVIHQLIHLTFAQELMWTFQQITTSSQEK